MQGFIDDDDPQPQRGRPPSGVGQEAVSTTCRTDAVGSIRRFSQALLATLLSTLIVIADRMVDAWTSGGMLLALVVLWLAVYVGLVLFTRVSARLAIWITAAWRDLASRTEPLVPGAREG